MNTPQNRQQSFGRLRLRGNAIQSVDRARASLTQKGEHLLVSNFLSKILKAEEVNVDVVLSCGNYYNFIAKNGESLDKGKQRRLHQNDCIQFITAICDLLDTAQKAALHWSRTGRYPEL